MYHKWSTLLQIRPGLDYFEAMIVPLMDFQWLCVSLVQANVSTKHQDTPIAILSMYAVTFDEHELDSYLWSIFYL